jgi:hypothetical protein
MGLWASLKYAVNSTIGTSKFKPINQIIDESCVVVASDELILKTSDFRANAEEGQNNITLFSVVANMNGTIRVRLVSGIIWGGGSRVQIKVNGTVVGSFSALSENEDGTRYIDFNVKRHQVISVFFTTTHDRGYASVSFNFCGHTMPAPTDGILI